MTTNFPTSLDSFTNIPDPTLTTLETEVGGRTHSEFHNDYNDAIEALEAKVGIDSSSVTSSHTYKLATLEAAFPSSSTDSQITLFSGTSWKVLKKATTTWIAKMTSWVLSSAIAGTDYVAPVSATGSGLTMSTAKILWRTTASTWAIEEITVGAGLSMTAWTLTTSALTASVYNNATTQTSSSTPDTWTPLVFDAERFDTSSFHDNSVNNSRLTVPAVWVYTIHVSFYFTSATSSNTNWVRIVKNGLTPILNRPLRDGAWAWSQEYYIDVEIKDNATNIWDYYEVEIKSSAANNMSVVAWQASNAFEIIKN